MARGARQTATDWLKEAHEHALDDVLTKPEASRLSERIYMYKNLVWNLVQRVTRRGVIEGDDGVHARLKAIAQQLRNAEWWMRSQEKIAPSQAAGVISALYELVSISNLVIESLPEAELAEHAERQDRLFDWINTCCIYFANRLHDEPDADEEPARKPRSRQPSTSTRRLSLTPVVRRAVYDKTDGICWYCGTQTDAILNFHVDHVHPVALGGTNDPDNLVPCCRECNALKRAKPLDAFRAARGGGLFWFEAES